MDLLDEIFEMEEPKARNKFLCWFHGRSSLTLEMLPRYMVLAAVFEWLDSVGLYIDRDTAYRCYRIWDYRESEPETDFTVEWEPDEEGDNSKISVIKQAVLLYLCKGQNIPKPSWPADFIDDLPF